MAIKRKGKTDFLRNQEVVNINTDADQPSEDIREESNTKKVSSTKTAKNQQGRPRKLLIDGVKEKSITVQLPENLLSLLRKQCKKQKKSMKELIGEPLIEKYKDLL